MEGDIAPLGRSAAAWRKYGAELIVDEAHATGVLGPEGTGMAAAAGNRARDSRDRAYLRQGAGERGRFCLRRSALEKLSDESGADFHFQHGDAAIFRGPDSRGAAILLAAADAERAHLQEIAAALREGLAAAGLDCGTSSTHIVPMILGSKEAALLVAGELQRKGFAVKAIRPPTVPAGTSRIRLSLTSRISHDEIQQACCRADRCGRAQIAAADWRQPAPCMLDALECRSQFFVTGTDTGIGKTVVSALLCAALDALYWKPIQTGTREGTDRETVMRIAELPRERTLPETYCFAPPVSPHLAARRAGVRIELQKIRMPRHCRSARL